MTLQEQIKSLETQEAEIKKMLGYKKKKFISGVLQISVENDKGKEEFVIFNISPDLAKRTLDEDIKEDTKRLKKLKKDIDDKKKKL